jgi:hypothetical protein
MKAEPLNKEIYNKAKELGVEYILLQFSGGSDEGHLYVDMGPDYIQDLASEVEDWAWNVYDYSGAGDGSEYGDNIEYDLVKNKVKTNEWFYSRQEGESDEDSLELVESEEEE